jgi:antitoxin component YwqK of YwqJK toxin-antitoxin module
MNGHWPGFELTIFKSSAAMTKRMENGVVYLGQVNVGDTAHGLGKMFYPNGNVMYDGHFFRGRRHRNGSLFYPNGELDYQVNTRAQVVTFFATKH